MFFVASSLWLTDSNVDQKMANKLNIELAEISSIVLVTLGNDVHKLTQVVLQLYAWSRKVNELSRKGDKLQVHLLSQQ